MVGFSNISIQNLFIFFRTKKLRLDKIKLERIVNSRTQEVIRKKNELEKLSKLQGSNLLEKILKAIDKQYYINYNLLTQSTFEVVKTKTYAQYKRNTYAHICIECNGITIHKYNTMLIPVYKH